MRTVTLSADKLSTSILLERHKQIIMNTWAVRVREKFPTTHNQSRPALFNALPQLMDAIVNALALVGFTIDARAEVSKEHAHQRFELGGYTLKQVLSEMRLLRETIFEVLEIEGGPLSQRDRDIILDSIEKGIITTGSEFMKLQLQEKNEELAETRMAALKVEADLYDSLSIIEKLEVEQKLRDLFISTLTHDLRSPLTSAKLNLQILEQQLRENASVKKAIERIDRSLVRADNMIETLLDANHMRSGVALSFNMTDYDLSEQVSEILRELSLTHGDRFSFQKPSHPVMVCLCREKIERAVENLLTNAIKYGSTTSAISVVLIEDATEVKIAVHNYGKAIAQEDQEAIFEPFFRSKSVLLGNQKGWGLGLTLVRGIAEGHGGNVTLSSSDTGGTTFSITLPRDAHKVTSSALS